MENDDFDRALGAARRLAEDYLDGLRDRPVARDVDPDALAAALDQNAGLWLGSPAAAEAVVLRWLKELFGLPAAWAGGITSGATMSESRHFPSRP